jgi:hypothetical protein
MPTFKYLVANQEGKKLSGTVEAPDQSTAQDELNNLGFSILSLTQSKEPVSNDPNLSKFIFEAVDKNMKLITGTIPAKDQKEAFTKLETQYGLSVSAIWKENSTPQEIEESKKTGIAKLREDLDPQQKEEIENSEAKSEEQKKQEEIVKTKIEHILTAVNDLLVKFDKEIDPKEKSEINKKIDKLLRIKHSTNLDYILETAKELLEFIQSQESSLKEKGFKDKRLELTLTTQNLLDELKRDQQDKSLSADIVDKIQKWQRSHIIVASKTPLSTKIINNVLTKIKTYFETPEEIKAFKDQISAYNKQLFELVKLYFKEPTAEYKQKVKNSFKTVWGARKTAKTNLKLFKKQLKEQKKTQRVNGENFFYAFIKELNSFSGWLIAFYIGYYFAALYITSKDFGLHSIPKGFFVYDSRIFKYALLITFILHACTALKVNFFKKSLIANAILIPTFFLGSIITLLNF